MSDLTSKDAEQDKQIAVLENYFGSIRERVIGLEERMTRKDDYDRLEKSIDELKSRVRLLEKWVWGAGAVIAAVIVIAGIAANAQDANAFTEDGLLEEPCPTELASRNFVTEVSVKPSKEEQE